jgi:hypothetical protein
LCPRGDARSHTRARGRQQGRAAAAPTHPGVSLLRCGRRYAGAVWKRSHRVWLGNQSFDHPAQQIALQTFVLTLPSTDRPSSQRHRLTISRTQRGRTSAPLQKVTRYRLLNDLGRETIPAVADPIHLNRLRGGEKAASRSPHDNAIKTNGRTCVLITAPDFTSPTTAPAWSRSASARSGTARSAAVRSMRRGKRRCHPLPCRSAWRRAGTSRSRRPPV